MESAHLHTGITVNTLRNLDCISPGAGTQEPFHLREQRIPVFRVTLGRHMLFVEKELELLLYLNYLVFCFGCFGFQLEPKDIHLNKLYSQTCDSTVPAISC